MASGDTVIEMQGATSTTTGKVRKNGTALADISRAEVDLTALADISRVEEDLTALADISQHISGTALADISRHISGTALADIWGGENLTSVTRKRKPPSGVISSVKIHDKDLNLLRVVYKSLKDEEGAPMLDQRLFNQKSPMGNTILHIAACYGNDKMVETVIRGAPQLVIAKNSNNDTPLHVAVRAGHFSTLKLFKEYLVMLANDEAESPENLLMSKNKKGNTILHDALINKHNEDGIIQLFDGTIIPISGGLPLSMNVYEVALEVTNKDGKSALYLAIELGYKNIVIRILEKCNNDKIPQGKSPLLAAIMNRDKGMLETIIGRKPEWIHLQDEEDRMALHWATSIGYLDGVRFLLKQCGTCSIERDKNGFYALHLASEGGHVEVLKELLIHCPDPKEIVDSNSRNLLHIAAAKGKLNVVKHILRDPNLEIMINDMDADGNTPLHLATLHSRPKVVYALTRDKRVKLDQMNLRNQTALEINSEQVDGENQPLRQRLVWIALKSAGTPRSSIMILPQNYTQTSEKVESVTCPEDEEKTSQLESFENKVKQKKSSGRKKGPNLEQFGDRINTLIVVSTLIITATFAGGFSLPGGVDNGAAVMLKRTMFHFYIFCITISMYGAISVTLILILAQLGDVHLLALSVKLARPLLGITVVTLSLAFLAGVYVAISPLGWFATSFLVIATICVVIVAFLYIILWLPSKSTFILCRCISYIPFHWLACVAEGDDADGNHKDSKH